MIGILRIFEGIFDIVSSAPPYEIYCQSFEEFSIVCRAKQEVLLGENGRMNMLAELNEMNRSFLTEISTQLLSQHSPTNDSERNDSGKLEYTNNYIYIIYIY